MAGVVRTRVISILAAATCTLAATAEQEEPEQERSEETAAPEPRRADISLSDGAEIPAAEIRARSDLRLLLLPEGEQKRWETPFSAVVSLRQFVVAEGMEKEWRWREGGGDAKIYTGRTYPWRKYGLEVVTAAGEKKRGTLLSGFALRVRYRRPLDRQDTAGAAEEWTEAIWLIQPKAKGECGQTLASLTYIAEIRFAAPAEERTAASSEPAGAAPAAQEE